MTIVEIRPNQENCPKSSNHRKILAQTKENTVQQMASKFQSVNLETVYEVKTSGFYFMIAMDSVG